jgi:hypothetical protein
LRKTTIFSETSRVPADSQTGHMPSMSEALPLNLTCPVNSDKMLEKGPKALSTWGAGQPKFWSRFDGEKMVKVPHLDRLLEMSKDVSFEINVIIC